jgi:hypothetical protein
VLDADPQWPTRLRMANDLIGRKVLDGVSKAEVIRLIGPPDDTSYFKD